MSKKTEETKEKNEARERKLEGKRGMKGYSFRPRNKETMQTIETMQLRTSPVRGFVCSDLTRRVNNPKGTTSLKVRNKQEVQCFFVTMQTGSNQGTQSPGKCETIIPIFCICLCHAVYK